MSVDEKPILRYRTGEQKLLEEATEGTLPSDSTGTGDLLEELGAERERVEPEELTTFRLNRKASVSLDLPNGRHVLHPFGIDFTVGAGGGPVSEDRRVRIDGEHGRIDVVCHPITIRVLTDGRTTPAALTIAVGGRNLLLGLETLLAEARDKEEGEHSAGNGDRFFRVRLYLPASLPDNPYAVNGVQFHVGNDGRVELTGRAPRRARTSEDGREIHLLKPSRQPGGKMQAIGIRWLNAGGEVELTAEGGQVISRAATNSAYVRFPVSDARRSIRIGDAGVDLPRADQKWPHRTVIWDVGASAGWLVETPGLCFRSGTEFRCRVISLGGSRNPPSSLRTYLEPMNGDGAAVEMRLMAEGKGVFTGELPTTPGLWRWRGGEEGPPAGRVLGLVAGTEGEPTAAVSLFTHHNRGLYRRGDEVEILWSAKVSGPKPAGDLAVVLRGGKLETPIIRIRIDPRRDGGSAGGSLELNTSALAPGQYRVVAEGEGILCYPLRLRICQREPESDFDLYSYVFNDAKPYGGSPLTAYYGNIPDGPGLAPFREDGDVSLDPGLGGYLDDPLADPMPFDVTLTGADGEVLFHKYAALGPEHPLEVPIPIGVPGTELELTVRDLVLGREATHRIDPAVAAGVSAESGPDFVGGAEPVRNFLAERSGPVTILLGEGQEAYRPAAEKMASLLRETGRRARVIAWDPAEVRPLPLRWKPLERDLRIIESLKDGEHFAWRVNMSPWVRDKEENILFDDPRCGYSTYGARLRIDRDVVLFGGPEGHRALADLRPHLRRVPSENYPAPGDFFVHYLWSPFKGGHDGLYLGCQDAPGASAAVDAVAKLAHATGTASGTTPVPDEEPVTTRADASVPLEDRGGKFGTPILDVEFAPDADHLFVTTAGYGDWLFTLSPDGRIRDHRTPKSLGKFPNWWRWARGVRPVGEGGRGVSLRPGAGLDQPGGQPAHRFHRPVPGADLGLHAERGPGPRTGLPGR